MSADRTAIIGAGPAGLTAADHLLRRDPGHSVIVLEASSKIGGISRTESHNGYRFDIGGHRFFTKVPEVDAMWEDVLGDEFITVQRLSRIFYRGRFFNYPLVLGNALSQIGAYESFRIALSYLKWKIRPSKTEDTFEEWVINRFGGRLYMHFFASYTEKVWGIPPSQIQADWAAQRIKNLSLSKAVLNALFKSNDTASLIEEFRYPRLGPGMMWEMTADRIAAAGGDMRLNAPVVGIERDGNRVTAVIAETPAGRERIPADHVINSMDLRTLIGCFDPPPPAEVREAAAALRFRDFLIVALILNKADPFPDNWIYVHSGDIQVGRIQNFRAWSRDMVPDDNHASIGMEYFCWKDGELWNTPDEELVRLASEELQKLGLAEAKDVVDGAVIRQEKAYPVYDSEYRAAVEIISNWLNGLENFQTVGRNGQHRYNNQDHSMLTGMYAAENILGADHDLWSVNVDRAYHEEFEYKPDDPGPETSPS